MNKILKLTDVDADTLKFYLVVYLPIGYSMELVVNANLLNYGYALTKEANDLSTNSSVNHFSDSMQMPRIGLPNYFWYIYSNFCGLTMLLLALPAKEIAELSAIIKFLY